MWKTLKNYRNGKPKLEINENGEVFSHPLNAFLIPRKAKTKRLYYKLRFNNKRKDMPIHILVAKAFPEICGEWFDGCEVHHKDENPENNNAYNLEVLSFEEHRRRHSLARRKKKEIKLIEKVKEKIKTVDRYFFSCRKSIVCKDGLAPVEFFYRENGKRYRLNTGIYMNPYTFNPKNFQL